MTGQSVSTGGESVPVGQGIGTPPAAVVKTFNEEERRAAEAGTLLPKEMEGVRLDAGSGNDDADARRGGRGGNVEREQDHAASYTNLGGVINGTKMLTAKLNNGEVMPLLGLGTWKSAKGEVGRAVQSALRMGYRHIDCARIYNNQDEVGEAFNAVLKEGVIKRDELFVTSKLWNDDHDPDRVEAACRETLKALQLDYLNLYLIHWPCTNKPGPTLDPPLEATWAAMEGLVDKGLVRSIGVSNVSAKKLGNLLQKCRIKPAVNQVEAHPWWRNDALFEFCRNHDIHLTAYSPLGSPDSAHLPGGSGRGDRLLQDPTVTSIAEKVKKTPGQVLLRWALQRGTSAIPKSVSPDRQRQNLDVLDWELPADAFKQLSSIEPQARMVSGNIFLNPEGPYRTLEELWDEENTPLPVKN